MIIKSYYRGTKNTNAKYEIDLLIYDEDNYNYHYVLVKTKVDYLTVKATLIQSKNTTVTIA